MTETNQENQPLDYDQPLDDELEAQIDAALEAAKHAPPSPTANKVEYLPSVHALSLHINTGQRLLLPIEDMQHLSSASAEQLHSAEIIARGRGIDFPALDVQFSVEGLLAGRRGNRKWMEQLDARRAAALMAAA